MASRKTHQIIDIAVLASKSDFVRLVNVLTLHGRLLSHNVAREKLQLFVNPSSGHP